MKLDPSVQEFIASVNKKRKGYYHNGAVELIKICRELYGVPEESPRQDHRLQEVLGACDEALKEAAFRSTSRGPTEDALIAAAMELDEYGREFHEPNNGNYEDRNYEDRVRAALDIDKNSNKSTKRIPWNPRDGSFGVVCFQILRSLPDELPDPIIVKQAIISPKLADIIWNFILANYDGVKRLSVAQNPHFYPIHPKLEENGAYRGDPVPELIRPYPETVYIFTNNERRVYLEFGATRRTFDRIWRTDDGLSFKDVIGRLESEITVEGIIPPPPLFWFRINRQDSKPNEGGKIGNWKTPIIEHWDSPDSTHIHIKNDHHCSARGSAGESVAE